jgi:hypothetical protein
LWCVSSAPRPAKTYHRLPQILDKRLVGPVESRLSPDQNVIETGLSRLRENLGRRSAQTTLRPISLYRVSDLAAYGKTQAQTIYGVMRRAFSAFIIACGPRLCLQDQTRRNPLTLGGCDRKELSPGF